MLSRSLCPQLGLESPRPRRPQPLGKLHQSPRPSGGGGVSYGQPENSPLPSTSSKISLQEMQLEKINSFSSSVEDGLFPPTSNVDSHSMIVFLFLLSVVCLGVGGEVREFQELRPRETKGSASSPPGRQLWLLKGHQGLRGSLTVAMHTLFLQAYL